MSAPSEKNGIMAQHLFLFGDQTGAAYSAIKVLSKTSKHSSLLETFLVEAVDVIKKHVDGLDTSVSERFNGFRCLSELAEMRAAAQHPDHLVDATLMNIAQLSSLILLVENDSTVLNSGAILLGLCSGVLPAIAAALSKSIRELLSFSLKLVSLSFILAVEVERRSHQIEDGNGVWGYSVINTSPDEQQKILDKFNKTNGVPLHRRAYLSVISENWATICGPPSVLDELFSFSPVLESAPKLKQLFGAAAHAPHLPPLEIDALIESCGIEDAEITLTSDLVSASTSQSYDAPTLRALLRQGIQDITQKPLLLSATVQNVAEKLRGSDSVHLLPVGPTNHTEMVRRTLEKSGIRVEMYERQDATITKQMRSGSGRIAIVGMSGRFPGSQSTQQFWESLLAQKEFHEKVPHDRFDVDKYFDVSGEKKNSTTVPYGNFLTNPGLFDPRFFRVSPREALQMDPIQRMLLMSTYEALETAGYSPNRTLSTHSCRIASFFGQASDDAREVNIRAGVEVHFIPSIQRAFYPGRLNYHFGWEGASYSVDSACSSSSTAVLLACNALLARQCDTAVAGGGQLLGSPFIFSGLSKGSFLSKTGNCKSFQDSADGYCRGEGVGVVVLKRLEDAIADNDNVLAVIRGGARNFSARAISIIHPSVEAQQSLYQELLLHSGVSAEEVGYVEMHATATQAGDVAEMQSVASIFGVDRAPDNPLYVGGVKASVGHGEAAAGITSLIKSVLMLKTRIIPGQPRFSGPLNSKFPPLHSMNIHIAQSHQPFGVASTRGDGKRKILLNNFDAGGGNTSLLLEEAPKMANRSSDPRSHQVVVVSAHTKGSLQQNKSRLLDYLRAHPDTNFSHLAYTTTSRRMHHAYRAAYVSSSTARITSLIDADSSPNATPAAMDPTQRVAFVFTGQGRSHPKIGTELFHSSATFRNAILSYQTICDAYGFSPFITLINGRGTLTPTPVQTQLATVAVELALLCLWRSWGVEPGFAIGHSLGEYAALCAAGVLSVHDALYLVGTRARLLQDRLEVGTHSMLSVAKGVEDIRKILGPLSKWEIACKNAPTSTVITSTSEVIERVEKSLAAKSVPTTRLDTPFAFHSCHMDSILEDFRSYANGVRFEKPQIPIASPLKGIVVLEAGVFNAEYLVQQTRHVVDFLGALRFSLSSGYVDESTLWIECGPHPTCLPLVAACLATSRHKLLPSLKAGEDDWKTLSTSTAAVYMQTNLINWPRFHREYERNLELLDLPTYSFDLKDYWIPFKEVTDVREETRGFGNTLHNLLTSSVQQVQSETTSEEDTTITFDSYISEPQLAASIQGHMVDSHSICPISVFADIAVTAARYLFRRINKSDSSFVLQEMTIMHPLVYREGNNEQKIVVTATHSTRNPGLSTIVFASQDGLSIQNHGKCVAKAIDPQTWAKEWSRAASLIKPARKGLLAAVEAKKGHVLSKVIAYKLFSRLVDYQQSYQVMQEIFVSDDFNEGFASIKLDINTGTDNFANNPYWVDGLIHLAGFMMNCTTSSADLYISTGFDSLRIPQQLTSNKTYTTFAHARDMIPHESALCDVYIFDTDELVGVCSGLRFRKMDRAVFSAVIQSGIPAASVSNKTTRTPLEADRLIISTQDAKQKAVISQENDKNFSHGLSEHPTNENARNDIEMLLRVVASQTGVDISDIHDSTVFADLGVDSLMSISIADTIMKESGIPLAASFFQENPSVQNARRALSQPSAEPANSFNQVPQFNSSSHSSRSGTLNSGESTLSSGIDLVNKVQAQEKPCAPLNVDIVQNDYVGILEQPFDANPESPAFTEELVDTPPEPLYESKVVFISGRRNSKEIPLFLIADGAGSATSYLKLPSFANGRPIYALESPWLRDPLAFTCSLEVASEKYVAAIRKTQPRGPYLVGGWSAGGVYAFEASKQLLDDGETVLGLLLLDMKAPQTLTTAPKLTIELLEALGITRGIERGGLRLDPMSETLKQHLLSTCRALIQYKSRPMDSKRRPRKTYIIWAKKGLAETMDFEAPAGSDSEMFGPRFAFNDKTQEWFHCREDGTIADSGIMVDAEADFLRWFYAKRTVFGSNGWEKLVGDNIKSWVVDADHFSMVARPSVMTTAKYMQEAVEECTRQRTN